MTSYGGPRNHLFCEKVSESNRLFPKNIPTKLHKMATLFSLNEEDWRPTAIAIITQRNRGGLSSFCVVVALELKAW